MNLNEFSKMEKCPTSFSPALRGLWFDKKGDWNTAHEIVQDSSGKDSAWVHAYLHRKEGDLWNANYWYRRCGRSEFKGSLEEEWQYITAELLDTL